MLCPVCKVALLVTQRQAVEIDYCPQCRGVWLDRGELDKIVERSVVEGPRDSAYGFEHERGHDDHEDRGRYREDERQQDSSRRPRRRSLLGDLFDFD